MKGPCLSTRVSESLMSGRQAHGKKMSFPLKKGVQRCIPLDIESSSRRPGALRALWGVHSHLRRRWWESAVLHRVFFSGGKPSICAFSGPSVFGADFKGGPAHEERRREDHPAAGTGHFRKWQGFLPSSCAAKACRATRCRTAHLGEPEGPGTAGCFTPLLCFPSTSGQG